MVDRSTAIIDNSDLIEKNYIKLLNIANGKTDQKRKIDEMHSLNEENLRTILRLRKELINAKKAQQNAVPHLELDKMDSDQTRRQSASIEAPIHEQQNNRNSTSPLKVNKNADSFFSKKLQEADRKIERYSELLREKESINEALENEVMRKDSALRDMQSKVDSASDKEYSEKQDFNKELQKQRRTYKEQIEQLSDQLDQKHHECKNLIEELNHKDQQLRSGAHRSESNYDSQKMADENSRLQRELMVFKDELNKYKLKLSQTYRDVEAHKSSLHSYEQHCEKLKYLNEELNKTLAEERSMNQKGRHKVQNQMTKINHKVNELEGYSTDLQNSNRDYLQKNDQAMACLNDIKQHVISGDMQTSRTDRAPGTVRSNLSGMFSSYSKNPLEMQNLEETVESITKEIKTKFDEMKGKVFNYQNAINKLQGEKQQMYQSMNQLKFDKSPAYGTPVTKAHSTSIKQHPLKESSSSKETEKSEAMIDYLRAEVSHLRDKNRSYEAKIEAMQKQTETVKTNNSQLSDFMSEILRSGKDLIYQLCSDPQLSEAFFYKEDSKFHGMESKY